jgi:hypothetical protein
LTTTITVTANQTGNIYLGIFKTSAVQTWYPDYQIGIKHYNGYAEKQMLASDAFTHGGVGVEETYYIHLYGLGLTAMMRRLCNIKITEIE